MKAVYYLLKERSIEFKIRKSTDANWPLGNCLYNKQAPLKVQRILIPAHLIENNVEGVVLHINIITIMAQKIAENKQSGHDYREEIIIALEQTKQM